MSRITELIEPRLTGEALVPGSSDRYLDDRQLNQAMQRGFWRAAAAGLLCGAAAAVIVRILMAAVA